MKITTKKSKATRNVSISKVGIFKAGTYGSTTDYSLIKHLPDNRGIDGGIDEDRVKKHMNDMINGTYMDMGWDGLINTRGQLTDGTHRVEAKMRLGLPVRYYVTTSALLNSTNKKDRFKAISYINSHNSQWTKQGTFKGSLNNNLVLAVAIKHLIDNVSANTGMFTKDIKVSWMFSIIKRNVKFFNNSKELNTAEVYDDNTLFKYTKTSEFKDDFNIFIELINIFKKYSRFNNITRYILLLHWTKSDFDIVHMLTNLNKYNFKLHEKPNAESIQREIQRIYNMKKGYKSYVKLFNIA